MSLASVQRHFAKAASARMREYVEIIERACEEAVQTGTHGVLVTHDWLTGEVTAEVTDRVPYGQIHEYQKRW